MSTLRHRTARAPRGFTLMETLIVLMLIMILTGIGGFAFGGFEETPEAQRPIDALAKMVKMASREAVAQGRPIVIGFDKKGFGYYGEGDTKDGRFDYPKGMKGTWKPWNGGKKFVPAEGLNWTFYSTGLSKALRFQFDGPQGIGEVSFNPLTGNVVEQSIITR